MLFYTESDDYKGNNSLILSGLLDEPIQNGSALN